MATSYRGSSVNSINKLRGQMHSQNVKFVVAKKTLMRIAAKSAGYEEIPAEVLDGPIALAFSLDDEVSAAKLIKEAGKELETLELMGGFMGGKVLSKAEAKQLADLPSFEELMAKFVGTINAPVSRFHGVLHGTLRNFAGVINAIKEEKEKAA